MRTEARRLSENSPAGIAPHPLLSDSSSLHTVPRMSPLTLEPPCDVAPGFFVSPKGYRLRSSLSGNAAVPRTLSFENGRPPLPAPATATPEFTAPRGAGRRAKAFSSSAPSDADAAEPAARVPVQLGAQVDGGQEPRRRRRVCSRGSSSTDSSPEASEAVGAAGQVGALVLGRGAGEQLLRADTELSVSVTMMGSPPGARSLGSDTPPQAGGPLDARGAP